MDDRDHGRLYDITIVGAGPTGLFGAFYAGLREMSCKIIDSLPIAGGQLSTLYPEKFIYDSPGFPEVLAKDLVANLVEQAGQWNPTYVLGEQAQQLTSMTIHEDGAEQPCWLIETDKGKHLTRTVLIAAGIGAFYPIRLDNESVARFEDRGVAYIVTGFEQYAGRKVLIVGGGDSAVDWALALESIAEHVTLIHRREGFRAHDSSVNALMQSAVEVKVFYELQELQGSERLERAVVFDNRTDEQETVEVDDVILALGFKADLGPIRAWGLETVGRRYLKVNCRMETNLPGVYAAGDIALQDDTDPLNLIVVGFGQVAVAVNYAYVRIKPGGKVFPGHTSEKMAKAHG